MREHHLPPHAARWKENAHDGNQVTELCPTDPGLTRTMWSMAAKRGLSWWRWLRHPKWWTTNRCSICSGACADDWRGEISPPECRSLGSSLAESKSVGWEREQV